LAKKSEILIPYPDEKELVYTSRFCSKNKLSSIKNKKTKTLHHSTLFKNPYCSILTSVISKTPRSLAIVG